MIPFADPESSAQTAEYRRGLNRARVREAAAVAIMAAMPHRSYSALDRAHKGPESDAQRDAQFALMRADALAKALFP